MAKVLRECYQMTLTQFLRDFPEFKDAMAIRKIDTADDSYIVRICPSMGIVEIGYPSDSNWQIPAPR